MEAKDIAVLIAASVGVLGFIFGAYQWWIGTRTKLKVTASLSFASDDVKREFISVHVINLSRHPVRITSFGFKAQNGSGGEFVVTQLNSGAPLPPETIEPHDKFFTYVDRSLFEKAKLDVYKKVTVWVDTATGKRFRSKGRTLLKRSD